MPHSTPHDWIIMTIFDAMTADYVSRVVNAFDTGTLSFSDGDDECAECDTVIDPYNDEFNHVVTMTPPINGERRVVVIIGCEWYRCIDPASVGMDNRGWSDRDGNEPNPFVDPTNVKWNADAEHTAGNDNDKWIMEWERVNGRSYTATYPDTTVR